VSPPIVYDFATNKLEQFI